jgi:hypothetical protein
MALKVLYKSIFISSTTTASNFMQHSWPMLHGDGHLLAIYTAPGSYVRLSYTAFSVCIVHLRTFSSSKLLAPSLSLSGFHSPLTQERQHLAPNNPSHSCIHVQPPVQIRHSSPTHRPCVLPCSYIRLQQHKPGNRPAFWRISSLRVQIITAVRREPVTVKL